MTAVDAVLPIGGAGCAAVAGYCFAQGAGGGFDAAFLQYGALGLLGLFLWLQNRRDVKRDSALDANTKALVDMTQQLREVVVATERVGEKRAELAEGLAAKVVQAVKDGARETVDQLREDRGRKPR